ncbi:hypothetical protein Q5752_002778 [Cryptotrichosporon argae]
METLDVHGAPALYPAATSSRAPAPEPARPAPPRVLNAEAGTVYPGLTVSNWWIKEDIDVPELAPFSRPCVRRPTRIPADFWSVDLRAVWCVVHPVTKVATFLVPQACRHCTDAARVCSRMNPECAACRVARKLCPGSTQWLALVHHNGRWIERDLKAADPPSAGSNKPAAPAAPAAPTAPTAPTAPRASLPAPEHDGGRGQRVQKKRRLSDSHVDPLQLGANGKPKRARFAGSLPAGARPVPGHRVEPRNVPPTSDDEAYFARVRRAETLPEIEHRADCSVSATNRRALQAVADWLRAPIATAGASVYADKSRIARGVILEGTPPGQGAYWGEGASAGTIVTTIGSRRFRECNGMQPMSYAPEKHPPTTIADDIARALHADASGSIASPATPTAPTAPKEAPAVDALLLAHRAQTPIGLVVAHDYSALPFRPARPYMALGWFWVTEAWTEPLLDIALFEPGQARPTGPPRFVVWKFRFDYCTGQPEPWWPSTTAPAAAPTPIADGSAPSWAFAGPDVARTTTLQSSAPAAPDVYACSCCGMHSRRVYSTGDICLNEACEWFFGDASSSQNEDYIGPRSTQPGSIRLVPRIEPDAKRYSLTGPHADDVVPSPPRTELGRDFWRAWTCHKCGLANERTTWSGLVCEEGCSFPIRLRRDAITDAELRDPNRPVSTGPRQDDGFASWTTIVARAATTYTDGIRVVRHTVDGTGAAVVHALAHEGVQTASRHVLRALQSEGDHGSRRGEVPFKRGWLPASSARETERALSPFYTVAYGADGAPPLDAFPVDAPIRWPHAGPGLEAMDLINERAGRMFPGDAEFNSLVVAAMPPHMPTSARPTIPLGPDTLVALLYLGSDGTVRVRSGNKAGSRAAGEITVQHGDVVGVRTGKWGMEIEARSDGFGFVCIARQVYDGPGVAYALPESADAPGKRAKPARPTKPPLAPLTNWYVGPWPLDRTQPVRALPSARGDGDASGNGEATGEPVPLRPALAAASTGQQVVEPGPELTTLAPPATSPLAREPKGKANDGTRTPTGQAAKGRKKGAAAGASASPAASPAPAKGKRKPPGAPAKSAKGRRASKLVHEIDIEAGSAEGDDAGPDDAGTEPGVDAGAVDADGLADA